MSSLKSMDTSQSTIQRVVAVACAGALALGLSACNPFDSLGTSGGTTAISPTATSSPGAGATPTPSGTPTAPSAADEAEQAAETTAKYTAVWDWAEGQLPRPDDGLMYATLYGYSEPDGPTPHMVTVTSLEAGNYSVHVICRGDGSVAFTGSSGDTEVMDLSGECTGEVQGLDVSTPATGASFTANPTGDVDYALIVTTALAR